ncbi:hypothetical protein [Micromonospora zhanjiangensis]|uniref:Immunity protein 50 n=1 Tax=Micromonospora zhanjiangensis TaxID=1522057 RepID=A0ABV8KXY2_9ACTN
MISLVAEHVDFDILSKNLFDKSRRAAGEDLTETDLHYTLFPSWVTCEVDGTVIIGPRRRVPLFDFLACVAQSIKAIRANEPISIGFTEAADQVYFRPVGGGKVQISTSGSDLQLQVDRLELSATLERFLSSGRAQLIDNVPGIQQNPHIGKLAF